MNPTLLSTSKLVIPSWHEIYFPVAKKAPQLAESVLNRGMLASNPLQVRRIGHGRYEVLDGVQRMFLAERLNIPQVHCVIWDLNEIEGRKLCIEHNLRGPGSGGRISFVHAIVLLDEYRRLGGNAIPDEVLLQHFNRKHFTLKRAKTCLAFAVETALKFAPNEMELAKLSQPAQIAWFIREQTWPPLNELYEFSTPTARWMERYYKQSPRAQDRKIGPRHKIGQTKGSDLTLEDVFTSLFQFPKRMFGKPATRVIESLDHEQKQLLLERLNHLRNLLV